MSKIKLTGHASGSGVLTIAAPNTDTDRTITLPDVTGTLLDSGSDLPAANLTGALPAISGANLTGVGVAGITSSADATAMTIDSSERVGIGTTSPTEKLQVHGSIRSTNNATTTLANSGNFYYIPTADDASNPRTVLSGIGTSSVGAHVTFKTGTSSSNAERMRITSVGKVGIGTTSPSVNVHIVDDASEGTPTFAGATHFAVQATASSSDNVNASLISGTAGVSRLMFGHKNDEDLALIQHSHSTGKMSFKVNGVSDVMTIDNYGRILTGTATDASVNPNGLSVRASSYGLYACKISHSAGTGDGAGILIDIENYSASNGITMIRFDTSAGQVGSIKSNQSSTAYNTSSDYRLKENVDYTWDATTRLKQLKPARFNFKNDDTNTLVDGFIAHEVSSVVPEAISGEKDAVDSDGNIDPQGIDQSKLVPLLVKTIQELEARITAGGL